MAEVRPEQQMTRKVTLRRHRDGAREKGEEQSPGEAGGKVACSSGLKVPVESGSGRSCRAARTPGIRVGSGVLSGVALVVMPSALGQGWGWSRPARWATALHT
mgnify:CR=1 FL=1